MKTTSLNLTIYRLDFTAKVVDKNGHEEEERRQKEEAQNKQEEAIVLLLKNGVSAERISEQLNLSVDYIKSLLEK